MRDLLPGRTTRENPIFAASLSRISAIGTARTSPPRPTSPNTAVPGGTTRSLKLPAIAQHSARSAAGSSIIPIRWAPPRDSAAATSSG